MADTERLRRDLYAAFKNRALMYWHVFDELRRALGEPQAIALLSSAIEARGREIGRQFSRYGPADLAGLRDAFVGGVPDDITLQRCPLKEAWQEAGVADADIAADTWQPGRDGCCHLHVRPGRAH
jgi:hypothetical protein